MAKWRGQQRVLAALWRRRCRVRPSDVSAMGKQVDSKPSVDAYLTQVTLKGVSSKGKGKKLSLVI